MKKLITCIFTFVSCGLFAGPYVKFNSSPTVGGGVRGSVGHHGLDFSADVEPKKAVRHYKGKALYLYYPKPDLPVRPYVGGGVTSRYTEETVPYPGHLNRGKGELGTEAVVGYEVRQSNKIKLFTQLELSNPQLEKRAIGISVGIGF